MLTQNKILLFIGKFFPIQGGIASSSILLVKDFIDLGFDVHILTNSFEVEPGFRQLFDEEDVEELMQFFPQPPVIHQLNRNPSLFHIPFSPSFEDRLFGKGLEVLENFKFDLIVSWYYQPYGLVAARLSESAGIPFTVCNAGSDLGRLSGDSNLNQSYKWMLKKASTIFSGATSMPLLQNLYGAEVEGRTHALNGHRKLPSAFNSNATPFNFEKFIRLARQRYQKIALIKKPHLIEKLIPSHPLNENVPILGMYGKCGEFKGSWDVLSVLKIVAAQQIDFQFVYLASGTEKQLGLLYQTLFNTPELIGKVWILPTVPYFQVPSFIRSCDAIFIMERNAPIAIHNLSTPGEILAVGTCMIVSEEVVSKSNLKSRLKDGDNAIIVESPKNHENFANKLINNLQKNLFEQIGMNGNLISQELNNHRNEHHNMALAIKTQLTQ